MSFKDEKHEKIKVSTSKVYSMRKRVYDSLIKFNGRTFDSASFVEACISLSLCFPNKCIATPVVECLLSTHLRKALELKDIAKIAAKLAGRADEVLSGKVITDNDWRVASEWSVVKIISLEKGSRTGKGGIVQRGAKLQLEVLTGPCSSLKYSKFWSSEMFRYAKHRVGFGDGSDSDKHPYMDESSFTSLYFLGLFDGRACKDAPDYSEFGCNNYLKSKNMALLKKRYRSIHHNNKFECPKGYPDSVQCHRCPIGLSECVAATHLNTYIESKCPECNKMSWMDPGNLAKCIDCKMCYNLKTV